MDRSSTPKLNREILEIIDIINIMFLKGIYRTFHPHSKEYTFFLVPHGTLSKLDHILGYYASPASYQTTTD